MVPIVWIPEADLQEVAPSAGWNAAATPQDKVRWATLYAWLRRRGAPSSEASTIATIKMVQRQMPHTRYGKAQERLVQKWLTTAAA